MATGRVGAGSRLVQTKALATGSGVVAWRTVATLDEWWPRAPVHAQYSPAWSAMWKRMLRLPPGPNRKGNHHRFVMPAVGSVLGSGAGMQLSPQPRTRYVEVRLDNLSRSLGRGEREGGEPHFTTCHLWVLKKNGKL